VSISVGFSPNFDDFFFEQIMFEEKRYCVFSIRRRGAYLKIFLRDAALIGEQLIKYFVP